MRLMRKERSRFKHGEILYTIDEMFEHRYGDFPDWWKRPIKYLYMKWKRRIYIAGAGDYINQTAMFYKKFRDAK